MSNINKCSYYDYDDYLQEAFIAAWEAFSRGHNDEVESTHHALFLIKKRTLPPHEWRHRMHYETNIGPLDIDIPTNPMQELHADANTVLKILMSMSQRDADALLSTLKISNRYSTAREMAHREHVSGVRINQLSQRALSVLRSELL